MKVKNLKISNNKKVDIIKENTQRKSKKENRTMKVTNGIIMHFPVK